MPPPKKYSTGPGPSLRFFLIFCHHIFYPFQLLTNALNCLQPFATVCNCFQLFLTVFIGCHPFFYLLFFYSFLHFSIVLFVFICFQPFSPVFNCFKPFSTAFKSLSTVFIRVLPFLSLFNQYGDILMRHLKDIFMRHFDVTFL